MRDGFCDWCAKCAKYLAFGTFERADDSALRTNNGIWFIIFLFIFLSHPNYNITFIFSFSHRLTASISILSYSFFFPFALFSSHSWIMSHHLTNSIIMSHHFTSSIISLIYKISFTGFFFFVLSSLFYLIHQIGLVHLRVANLLFNLSIADSLYSLKVSSICQFFEGFIDS